MKFRQCKIDFHGNFHDKLTHLVTFTRERDRERREMDLRVPFCRPFRLRLRLAASPPATPSQDAVTSRDACPTKNKAFEGGLWCGRLARASSTAVGSCGRDASTTNRSVEVDQIPSGAAALEELAGACEIVVAAAQHQRPPQLDLAAEIFEDGDGGTEVLLTREERSENVSLEFIQPSQRPAFPASTTFRAGTPKKRVDDPGTEKASARPRPLRPVL